MNAQRGLKEITPYFGYSKFHTGFTSTFTSFKTKNKTSGHVIPSANPDLLMKALLTLMAQISDGLKGTCFGEQQKKDHHRLLSYERLWLDQWLRRGFQLSHSCIYLPLLLLLLHAPTTATSAIPTGTPSVATSRCSCSSYEVTTTKKSLALSTCGTRQCNFQRHFV